MNTDLFYITEEVTLKYLGTRSYLYNTKSGSTPVVAHGNGPIKVCFMCLTMNCSWEVSM